MIYLVSIVTDLVLPLPVWPPHHPAAHTHQGHPVPATGSTHLCNIGMGDYTKLVNTLLYTVAYHNQYCSTVQNGSL